MSARRIAAFRVCSAACELLYALPSNWLTVIRLFSWVIGSSFLGLRGFASSCAVQEKEHRDGLVAFVSPCVARTVLHDHVAAVQMQSLAFVELQPHLTVVDNCIVDGVRFVHSRVFLFAVIC